jgi:DNA-directed RNA polymerase subunit beta'
VFEARRPKKTAIMAEHSGRVSIANDKHTKTVTIEGDEKNSQYPIPYNYNLIVQDGDWVAQGAPLTEGYMSPQDIIKINGLDAVYDYIIREVQRVYRIQSVEINDKHIEVIARQMTRKCRIEEQGDTDLLSGSTVHVNEFISENEKIKARIEAGEHDIRYATMQPILLGITKAALMTESFLSAASFQETTKVLTEAAIGGKVDNLQGLKENVIIGKLIPAGTGLERYRNIEIRNKDGSDPNAKLAERMEAAAAEDLARQKAAFDEVDDAESVQGDIVFTAEADE